jgi:dipeptidyl aminopeptidase/acylaminoacyl peptidase
MVGAAALAAALAGLSPPALPAACQDLLPAGPAETGVRRRVEPEDLVRLRDIGPLETGWMSGRLISLSPDGRLVAFQIRRGDPERNELCQAMLVLEARAGARPHVIDSGGELIRLAFDFRGKAGFPSGLPVPVTPHWSADGRFVFFLKRTDGVTQVWRALAVGGGSEGVTTSRDDVLAFRLLPDGKLAFATRPGLRAAREAIDREGLSGFHYDDRYSPVSSSRPFPPAPIDSVFSIQDLSTGFVRPATRSESETLRKPASSHDDSWTSATSADGRIARIERDPALLSGGRLVARTPDGAETGCDFPACRAANRPWWRADGRALRYFARDGWARASTSIYEWEPGGGPPRRLYTTRDLLADCIPDGDALLCLRERSLSPRRLERLDPASGAATLLFDPNPEFGSLILGKAERLHWTNDHGFQSVGDLVLPAGYRSGTRYPLVVVQYDTRGFLRGGTGDEFPIQAFAGRGYAVLSVSRPASFGDSVTLRDADEADRLNLLGFRDRRSTLSTVEIGVRIAIGRGVADPARIGITGLSDGATTVSFALIHSGLFRAAAVANCCFEPSLPFRVGPSAARHFYKAGYPRLTDRADAFWAEMSLARNGARIRAPILFQVADDELMSTLETFTGLREASLPADLYVFPGEHHVIWQPAHRLAIFRRALDWFDYWLIGRRSGDPERQGELAHWERMRAAWKTAPQRDVPPSQ